MLARRLQLAPQVPQVRVQVRGHRVLVLRLSVQASRPLVQVAGLHGRVLVAPPRALQGHHQVRHLPLRVRQLILHGRRHRRGARLGERHLRRIRRRALVHHRVQHAAVVLQRLGGQLPVALRAQVGQLALVRVTRRLGRLVQHRVRLHRVLVHLLLHVARLDRTRQRVHVRLARLCRGLVRAQLRLRGRHRHALVLHGQLAHQRRRLLRAVVRGSSGLAQLRELPLHAGRRLRGARGSRQRRLLAGCGCGSAGGEAGAEGGCVQRASKVVVDLDALRDERAAVGGGLQELALRCVRLRLVPGRHATQLVRARLQVGQVRARGRGGHRIAVLHRLLLGDLRLELLVRLHAQQPRVVVAVGRLGQLGLLLPQRGQHGARVLQLLVRNVRVLPEGGHSGLSRAGLGTCLRRLRLQRVLLHPRARRGERGAQQVELLARLLDACVRGSGLPLQIGSLLVRMLQLGRGGGLLARLVGSGARERGVRHGVHEARLGSLGLGARVLRLLGGVGQQIGSAVGRLQRVAHVRAGLLGGQRVLLLEAVQAGGLGVADGLVAGGVQQLVQGEDLVLEQGAGVGDGLQLRLARGGARRIGALRQRALVPQRVQRRHGALALHARRRALHLHHAQLLARGVQLVLHLLHRVPQRRDPSRAVRLHLVRLRIRTRRLRVRHLPLQVAAQLGQLVAGGHQRGLQVAAQLGEVLRQAVRQQRATRGLGLVQHLLQRLGLVAQGGLAQLVGEAGQGAGDARGGKLQEAGHASLTLQQQPLDESARVLGAAQRRLRRSVALLRVAHSRLQHRLDGLRLVGAAQLLDLVLQLGDLTLIRVLGNLQAVPARGHGAQVIAGHCLGPLQRLRGGVARAPDGLNRVRVALLLTLHIHLYAQQQLEHLLHRLLRRRGQLLLEQHRGELRDLRWLAQRLGHRPDPGRRLHRRRGSCRHNDRVGHKQHRQPHRCPLSDRNEHVEPRDDS
mmetsp:Transcript_29436/g.96048  ORF Transcript_29436/g.96048 Transcript_29436/m.96048 type:complete len:962 (-) Transcript_29436:48-2933(-)